MGTCRMDTCQSSDRPSCRHVRLVRRIRKTAWIGPKPSTRDAPRFPVRPLDPAGLQYGCSKSGAGSASVLEIEVLFGCKQAHAGIHTLARADQGLHAAGGCVLCPTVGEAVPAACGCVAHGWPSGLPELHFYRAPGVVSRYDPDGDLPLKRAHCGYRTGRTGRRRSWAHPR